MSWAEEFIAVNEWPPKKEEMMKAKKVVSTRNAGTSPMAMHKNLVIRALLQEPADVENIMPGFDNADDAVRAIKEHPGEWIIGGKLLAPDDPDLPEHLRAKEEGK